MARSTKPASFIKGGILTLCLSLYCQSVALEVRIDYRGNHPATDRNWYYQEVPNGGGLPLPIDSGGTFYDEFGEQAVGFTAGAYDAPGIVYTKGNTVKARFWIDNAGGPAHSGTVTIQPGGLGNTATWVSGTSANYTVGANASAWTQEVTLGTLPDSVKRYTIALSVIATSSNNQISGGGSVSTPCYSVYDNPKGIMSGAVWLELVKLTTSWADGLSTELACTGFVTYNLFHSGIFKYNLGEDTVPAKWVGEDRHQFGLKPLLDAYESYGTQWGNCVDVSDFLSLCLASQGIDSVLQQVFAAGNNGVAAFITNKVTPIGYDTWFAPVAHILFSMHQQCWTSGSSVNDAALSFYHSLSGTTPGGPALSWPFPGYWQTGSGTTPLQMYGLAYRLFDPVLDGPGTSPPEFDFGVIDPGSGPDFVDPALAENYTITELVPSV